MIKEEIRKFKLIKRMWRAEKQLTELKQQKHVDTPQDLRLETHPSPQELESTEILSRTHESDRVTEFNSEDQEVIMRNQKNSTTHQENIDESHDLGDHIINNDRDYNDNEDNYDDSIAESINETNLEQQPQIDQTVRLSHRGVLTMEVLTGLRLINNEEVKEEEKTAATKKKASSSSPPSSSSSISKKSKLKVEMKPRSPQLIIDATFGFGTHSEAILRMLTSK